MDWSEGDEPARSKRRSTRKLGGAGFFLRRFKTVKSLEEGWQEPCESRGSRTVLRGAGGEIPPVYPTLKFLGFGQTTISGILYNLNNQHYLL